MFFYDSVQNKIEAKLREGLLKAKASSEALSVITECYTLLALCGGGGDKKGADGWSLYADKLIGSLHDVLDKLYVDLETGRCLVRD